MGSPTTPPVDPTTPREWHGFEKPAGNAMGFDGVRVRVENSVPCKNPYPCHGYPGFDPISNSARKRERVPAHHSFPPTTTC